MNILEDNLGEILCIFGHLGTTLTTESIKQIIDKLDFIKSKISLQRKAMPRKWKGNQGWRKYLPKARLTKSFYETYKEHLQLMTSK